jgi:hypothetical protein
MKTALRLSTKLYENRGIAKALLGPRYAESMKKTGELLQAVSTSSGKSILDVAADAATELAKDDTREGNRGAMTILAAAVEILDPSKGEENV